MRVDWVKLMTVLNAIFWIGGVVVAVLAFYGYKERHEPFAPLVSFGNPSLVQYESLLTVAVPLSLTNSGSDSGCIRDLSLRIQSGSAHTRWVLFPIFLLDARSYFRDTTKLNPYDAFESPPEPIKLSGHERLEKSILFMPRPVSNLQPLQVKDLTPDDHYVFEMNIVSTGQDCLLTAASRYAPAMKAEYVLTGEIVRQLAAGKRVVPLDSATDSLRENFLRSP